MKYLFGAFFLSLLIFQCGKDQNKTETMPLPGSGQARGIPTSPNNPSLPRTGNASGACIHERNGEKICMQYYNLPGNTESIQRICELSNDRDEEANNDRNTTYAAQCPTDQLLGLCDVETNNQNSGQYLYHYAIFYYHDPLDEREFKRKQKSVEKGCSYLANGTNHKAVFKTQP